MYRASCSSTRTGRYFRVLVSPPCHHRRTQLTSFQDTVGPHRKRQTFDFSERPLRRQIMPSSDSTQQDIDGDTAMVEGVQRLSLHFPDMTNTPNDMSSNHATSGASVPNGSDPNPESSLMS